MPVKYCCMTDQMNKILTGVLILCLSLIPVQSFASQDLSEAFSKLLSESGLNYQDLQNYHALPGRQDTVLSYEHAVRHDTDKLEIRYSIRPLHRIRIDYQDPHSSAPEPNHMFNMLFSSLVDQFSQGGDAPRREYDTDQAKQFFNADWAAAAVFDVDLNYSEKYSQALIVAIHKNDKADAYMVYLFNDYPDVKSLIDDAFSSLQFTK